METKFKIGDVIKSTKTGKISKVIDIIFGKKIVKGQWHSGSTELEVLDSYITENPHPFGDITYVKFEKDNLFDLFQPATDEIKVTRNCCPRCGGELKDKISEYTGTIVKKCKCGWCD
jgi:hypothetical protein